MKNCLLSISVCILAAVKGQSMLPAVQNAIGSVDTTTLETRVSTPPFPIDIAEQNPLAISSNSMQASESTFLPTNATITPENTAISLETNRDNSTSDDIHVMAKSDFEGAETDPRLNQTTPVHSTPLPGIIPVDPDPMFHATSYKDPVVNPFRDDPAEDPVITVSSFNPDNPPAANQEDSSSWQPPFNDAPFASDPFSDYDNSPQQPTLDNPSTDTQSIPETPKPPRNQHKKRRNAWRAQSGRGPSVATSSRPSGIGLKPTSSVSTHHAIASDNSNYDYSYAYNTEPGDGFSNSGNDPTTTTSPSATIEQTPSLQADPAPSSDAPSGMLNQEKANSTPQTIGAIVGVLLALLAASLLSLVLYKRKNKRTTRKHWESMLGWDEVTLDSQRSSTLADTSETGSLSAATHAETSVAEGTGPTIVVHGPDNDLPHSPDSFEKKNSVVSYATGTSAQSSSTDGDYTLEPFSPFPFASSTPNFLYAGRQHFERKETRRPSSAPLEDAPILPI